MNRILFTINSVLLIGLMLSNTHVSNIKTTDTSSAVNLVDTFKPTGQLQAASGIQVNSLPHPFNVNGTMPYQVWVNGERLPLNGNKAKEIVKLLDIGPFEQPKDTAELHSGAGWLQPLPTTQ